jgi:hypothetical protein
VYKRLEFAALDKGLRGFSPIVEEALNEYFQSKLRRKPLADAITAAKGAWSQEGADEWEREREQAWATWRLLRS